MADPPVITVEFGLANGATFDPLYLVLGSVTSGVLGTNQLAPTDTLSAYPYRVMSVQVDHASTRTGGPIIEYNARTCTVELHNSDGVLDPYTIEAAGLTAPGVVMRVRTTYAGVGYPVFYGYVDGWQPNRLAPDAASVTVTATDGFSLLERQKRAELVAPVGLGENTGARIIRILDANGWPIGLRSIAVGNSNVQATLMGGSALAEAQDAVKNEAGEFYIQPDGVAVFRNRRALFSDARSVTSQATFGSDTAGGELPYVGAPGMVWDRSALVNKVVATRTGGVTQTVTDVASIGRYGEYAIEESALTHTSDEDTFAWSKHIVSMDKNPEFRFTSIRLNCALLPDLMYPQALGRKFGDRITVVRRVPGGITDSRQLYIRSVGHSWSSTSQQWITTWGLEPVIKSSFLVLDHPTQGVLGSNSLAW